MRYRSFAGMMVLVSMAVVRTASAWNATGHEVVAYVAWSQLTPEAKARVTEILKGMPDNDYAKTLTRSTTVAANRDEEAFVTAATWPDIIRNANAGANTKYHRPNWHYVDIPFVVGNVPVPPLDDLKWAPGEEPGNAIQAIKKSEADLKDPKTPTAERAVALCWVEHLVGDIHQPLHAVSMFSETYPEGDKGGNSQSVKSDGRVSNLHSLWDGMLGGFMPLGDVKQIATKLEAAHPPKELEKETAISDPDRWAQESYDLAKKAVYLDGKLVTGKGRGKNAPDLPAGYLDAAKPLAGRQGAIGGYRLAAVLNAIFAGQGPATATSPASQP